MKARHELNMNLYNQKANGQESESLLQNNYLALRQGDIDKINQQLKNGEINLQRTKRSFSNNPLRNMIYSFVTEANKAADAAISAGMSADEAYSLSDIYIRKADKYADADSLNDIFADLCRDFTERINEIKTLHGVSAHVRKCHLYIYSNLNGDLSVKGLAEYAGLDPSYLSKLFSKETGMTIKRYVTNAKIDTARNLLRYTGLAYIEIACSLGFSSQSAFIRTFRKETGMTPKEYRRKYV